MGDAFTFNGVDAGSYGVTVVSRTTQVLADVTESYFQRGISEGAVDFGGTRQPKRWTDNCYMVADDEAELRTYMDALCGLIDPRNGPRLYVGGSEANLAEAVRRGQYCRVNGPINASLVGFWAYQFQLNWINIRGTELSAAESASNGNSGSFNIAAGGTAYAYPTYVCSASSFTLTNTTTGEAIQIIGDPSMSNITLNSWNRTATATIGSTVYNILGYMTPGGKFPRLQPGVTNAFTISSGTVSLTWRNEWL